MRFVVRAAGLLAIVCCAGSLAAQAAVASFIYSTDYSRKTIGHVAVLDLGANRIATAVTKLDTESCKSPDTVSLETTRAFANSRKAFLAVAANTGPAVSGSQRCGLPDGLLISNYGWSNWPQSSGPVLYFPDDTSAVITDGPLPWPVLMANAVAGSTTQDSDCPPGQTGTLLVKNGQPGTCPIPKSQEITARTGIGVDATGRYLIVLVASRAEQAGLRTADFARLMIAFGAAQAVNLDGGGSTTFYWLPSHGVPAECEACATRISTAKVPGDMKSNPRKLSIAGLTLRKLTEPIEYSASNPPRRVYASIAFELF